MTDRLVLEAEMRRALRLRHTSLRTESACLTWFRRFRAFTGERPGVQVRAGDVVEGHKDVPTTICTHVATRCRLDTQPAEAPLA